MTPLQLLNQHNMSEPQFFVGRFIKDSKDGLLGLNKPKTQFL